MAEKEVKIKVVTDVEDTKVQSLEQTIENIENKTANVQVNVEDGELISAEEKEENLNDTAQVDVDVEDGELDATKSKVDDLDGTTIDIDVNNISAMEAVDQIGQGFDRLKQGASEVAQQMGEVLGSAGRMEQTEAFLSMNMGADQAKQKLEEIRNVTDQLPGDDVALQNLLSQAAMKDASMTTDAFNQMGNAAADYMAAMQNFGKTSTETQQDLMNYILAGNTAEIERSPILQSHVDKLKEGTTIQERAKLLQEALTAEGWDGISQQDTYNNKLQTFNDMLERGKMGLGGMFQEGAKGAMDFLINLDNDTNGLVGMGIAAAGLASPMADAVMGLGQMATGIKAIKDLGMIQWLKDLEIVTKLSAAADWILSGAQAVLNAVMSLNPIVIVVLALIALAAALIWAYHNVDWFREMVDNAWKKLQEFAGYIMGALSGAIQWLSDAFNNAGQTMQDAFSGAVDFVMGVLQGLFDYITSAGGLIPENVTLTGNQIIDALLGIMMFISTLPLQIAMIFINVIAQALGFGQNFSQTMMSSAMNAINGFITWMATLPGRAYTYLSQVISRVVSWGGSLASNFLSAASKSVSNFGSQIAQIPQRLGAELSSALDRVNEWAATLPAKFWEAGVNAVKNFLSALGIASPGTMQRMLVWEVTEMGKRVPEESRQLLTNVGRLGENIVDEFGEPKLGVSFDDTANASFTNLTEGQTRANVINLNLEIGSVDNEERINEIVEAVRKELAWNNLLAGRTVDDI